MEGAPKVGVGDSSAAGAAVGTAVLGPGIGTVVGGIAGGLFKSGSPRYEGGPLYGSVQGRLRQLASNDQTAIAQTHQDAATGGTGWRDVALVLAPAVRPDLFGSPARPLNALEQSLVAPFLPPGVTVANIPAAGSKTFNAGSGSLASIFGTGGLNPTTLLLVGGGLFLASKAFGGRRRARR